MNGYGDRYSDPLDSAFEELGIDSMDAVEILFALENEFDINIPDDVILQDHPQREKGSTQYQLRRFYSSKFV